MQKLIRFLAISLFFLMAALAGVAGRYTGEWKSNGGAGNGSFRMGLEEQSGGSWKCEFSFTLGGEDIKTTIQTCKVEQSKLDAAYDFELQGNALRSHVSGQWDGKSFAGKYETTAVGGGDAVDEGTWTAAPEAK